MLQNLHRKKKNKLLTEEQIRQLHHEMMLCYGWIPLEEFKKIPIPTLLSLGEKVVEHNVKVEKFMVGVMRLLGYKGTKI